MAKEELTRTPKIGEKWEYSNNKRYNTSVVKPSRWEYVKCWAIANISYTCGQLVIVSEFPG